MIAIWKSENNQLVRSDTAERHTWMDIRNATREDLDVVERDLGVKPDHVQDIMDIDEPSRIEKEDGYTMLIVRIPVYDARYEVPYFTVPLGVILLSDRIVTICQADSDALEDLVMGRQRGVDVRNRSAFVLNVLGRAAIVYLRYLKDLNRRTAAIERELQRSVKNHELVQLLDIEKSLVYFNTSLKSNGIVLDKMPTARFLRLKEDEAELLEDVLTDNRQAIEMAGVYSDILSGMMDAFASVISNNLNIVMKRLTSISVILMLSTLIVSAFSMNVPSPLSGVPDAFWIITGISATASLIGGLLIRGRKTRKPSRFVGSAA